jgi:GT2 family glycosyltransferase
MITKIFVSIPSYNRAKLLQYVIRPFLNSKIIHGFIIVAQGTNDKECEEYAKLINRLKDTNFDIIYVLTNKRMGSARARNKILELASSLDKNNILIIYDDDFIYPGDHSLIPAILWLKHSFVGLVGGRVINLRKRKVDPDFYLNIPRIADALTQLTGFIILNTKHGPREAMFTPHPFAMKIEVISKGIRYDENYGGTGYREESDFQMQVRKLGYKIIFEPRFYAYHLALESGGNRYSDLKDRMYWKWRNHTYFMIKWRYPLHKKILSYMILSFYALLNGPSAIKGLLKASRAGK